MKALELVGIVGPDLKNPKAIEIGLTPAERADALMEGFRILRECGDPRRDSQALRNLAASHR